MQSTMQPPRRRGVAFSTGIIFALIAAIVIFGSGALNGFRTGTLANQLWGWAWIFALFATPLLAGFVGALRSSRIGSGTLAGLWDGLFVGLWIAAYLVIVYYLAGSNLDAFIKQLQDQMVQRGTSVTIIRDTLLAQLIIADVLLVIIFLGIGTLLGLIGALIGKPFAPRRRY
jgi:hypothetical protein